MSNFNNNDLNFSLNSTLEQSLIDAQELLGVFAADLEFDNKIKAVFGNDVDIAKAKVLIGELARGNSSYFPKIEIRSASEINGAFGAFAVANNTIYLSQEFLSEKANDIESIKAVVLEELGHFIDSQLNTKDTTGDEGELFSILVRGIGLGDGELQKIKTEDDSAIVTIDGQTLQIEQANYDFGLREGYGYIDESIFYNDQDFFTFEISSTGQSEDYVGIASDSQSVDLILELYDEFGNFVTGANDYDYTYNLEIVSLAGLDAGIYTARVYDYFGGYYVQPFEAPYRLVIDAPEALANAGVEIQESNGGTSLSEAGTTDTYTLVLKSQPSANVTVNIAPDNQSTTTPTSITFTPSNWNTPKTVTVRAVDDSVVEGNHTTTISHTVVSGDSRYNGITVDPVIAAIADNDTRTIVIQRQGSINVTEGGSSVQNAYFVQLLAAPNSPVTVTISTDGKTTATSSLTFNSGNWSVPQGITVGAVDDSVVEGNHTSTITHTTSSADSRFNGVTLDSITVNITDNDNPGIKITESGSSTNLTEGGATDTYQIQLSSQPNANVTVNINPDAQSTRTPTALTFTPSNWSTPQTVTITAVDDAIIEGNHTSTISHTLSSTDSLYNGVTSPSVTANIADNDRAGVQITQSGGITQLTEGGSTDTYTVVLTGKPTANVTITVAPDTQATTTPTSLTFTPTNWNTPQTVTVGAVNDTAVEGDHTSTIRHSVSSSDNNYNGIVVDTVTANITDNDSNAPAKAELVIVESGGNTRLNEGGAGDTYTIALKSQPTANVTITVSPDNQATLTPTTLTFTPTNWSTPQTVTLNAVNDTAVEGTHTTIITHNVTSTDANFNGIVADKIVATINDNDNDNFYSSFLEEENPAFDLIDLDLVRQDPLFRGIDGTGIGVAVIDTGIDATHPLLSKNVRYVEDIYRRSGHSNFRKDEDGHGTHVAGTIGSTDPQIGIANDVTIVGVKTIGDNAGTLDQQLRNVEVGLQWVLENYQTYNIKVINMSLGDPRVFYADPNAPLTNGDIWFDEVEALVEAGITVVSAAGNFYREVTDYLTNKEPWLGSSSPGIYSTLNVGAVYDEDEGSKSYRDGNTGQVFGDSTTDSDRHTYFSFRPDPEQNNTIFAPGAFITSTLPDNNIGDYAGTSMAAPHVAGIVALMQEAAFQFGGQYLSPAKVQEILISTGEIITDGDDEDTTVPVTDLEYSRLNAYNALKAVHAMFAAGGGGGNVSDSDGSLTAPGVQTISLGGSGTTVVDGTIGVDGGVNVGDKDVDLVKFVLTTPANLTIETLLAENSTETDTILRVFDDNGEQIGFNDDKVVDEDFFSKVTVNLQPGTYFAGVSGYDNSQYDPTVSSSGVSGYTGDYQLAFSYASSADGTDPNGLLASATRLNVLQDPDQQPIQRLYIIGSDNARFNDETGVFEGGTSVGKGDVDLFVVEVPDNGKLFIDIDTPDNVAQYFPGLSHVNSLIRIFDLDGNQIAINDDDLAVDPVFPFPEIKKDETDIGGGKTIGEDGNEGHTSDSFISLDVQRGQKFYIGVSNNPNNVYDPDSLAGRNTTGETGYYQLWINYINNDLNGAIPQATDTWKLDVDAGTQFRQGIIGLDGFFSTEPKDQVGDNDVDFHVIRSATGGWLEIEIESTDINPSDELFTRFPTLLSRIQSDSVNTILKLWNADGDLLASDDDSNGQDPFLRYRIDPNKDYFVSTSGFGNSGFNPLKLGSGTSGDTGFYGIKAKLQTASDYSELYSDNQIGNQPVQQIRLDEALIGNVGKDAQSVTGNNDLDLYFFQLQQQQKIQIRTSAVNNNSANTFLRLFKSDGTQIAANDDFSPTTLDSRIEATLTPDTYYIGVNGSSAQAGNYNPFNENSVPDAPNIALGDYGLSLTVSENNNTPSSGNDSLTGGAGNDTIDALAGNDTINAGAGNDTLIGGAGNDTIRGEAGNDAIAGGDGNDAISGGDGNDRIRGNAGNDTIDGGNGNDTFAESGDFSFVLTNSNLTGSGTDSFLRIEQVELTGGISNNTLNASAFTGGSVILNGGSGNDTMIGGTGNDTIRGEVGNDAINGGSGNDAISGGDGNDRIAGGAGNDTIDGGLGTDTLVESGNFNFTLVNNQLTGNGTDSLSNIEQVELTGGISNNTLNASAFTLGSVILNGGAGNDVLTGSSGKDTLRGEAGNDSLTGGIGNDAMSGGDGNDRIAGGVGNDIIDGGLGTDTLLESGNLSFTLSNTQLTGNGTDSLVSIEQVELTGGIGNNTINASAFTLGSVILNGGSGNDTMMGGTGNDTIRGEAGNDAINGGAGNDAISGGDGNDRIAGGAGNDTIDGGLGTDTLVESGNFNFTLVNNQLTGNGTDSLSNIEQVELTGGIGNNTLNASAFIGGSVILNGGAGNDSVTGGSGNDILRGEIGNDTVNGGAGNDAISGGDGNDTLRGEVGNDILNGGTGNDAISGGDGNDRITGDAGNDIIDGGNGIDTLVESGDFNYLLTNTSLTGNGTNTLVRIEQVELTGGINNNTLNASAFIGGSVILNGGAGNDTVMGGTGNDTIRGEAGNDAISGGDGNDAISGGDGNDRIRGGAGNDTIDGGNGIDTLAETGDFNYILTNTNLTGNGTDTLSNIEQVELTGGISNNTINASAFNRGSVNLNGGDGNDALTGGSSNDILTGGNGNDTLTGSLGNDTLTGSAGSDRFTFNSSNQGIDKINDFSVLDDTIVVSAGGFGGGLVANAAITAAQFVIGSGATTGNQRFIYNNTTGGLFFDVDGNGGTAQIQIATLNIGLAMTNNDIFVI